MNLRRLLLRPKVAREASRLQRQLLAQAVEEVLQRGNRRPLLHFGQWVLLRQWLFMLGDLPEGS